VEPRGHRRRLINRPKARWRNKRSVAGPGTGRTFPGQADGRYNAAKKGKVGQRVGRRAAGKATGKAMLKLFK